MRAFEVAQQYTKSTPHRLKAMASALVEVDRMDLEGDVVECGVWKGGNIILARLMSPGRRCWLYDTFDGMPPPTAEDGLKAQLKFQGKTLGGRKMTAVSRSEVESNLRHTGTWDADKTILVEGKVEDTLKTTTPEKIAILRLDTDWYASTLVELRVLWPLLQPGGFLIVDDYGHWPGAKRAVHEYFGGEPDCLKVDYTCILMVKPY